MSDFVLHSFDLDKCEIRGESMIPVLGVVGEYVLKGQLLVFPINGQGLSNNTFSKYTFICNNPIS